MLHISFWQCHFRHRNLVKAKRAATPLAMEMKVQIVIHVLVMASTQFVTDTTAILDGMDEMVLMEECHSPENTGLVNRADNLFQLGERKRTPCIRQRLNHQNTIRGRPDAVPFHQIEAFVVCQSPVPLF